VLNGSVGPVAEGSWLGLMVNSCLTVFYICQMNWVKFCNGCAMMTALYVVSLTITMSALFYCLLVT